MELFRRLNPEEEIEFRLWAQENYKPFDPIKGIWHPIVQEECTNMNKVASIVAKVNDANIPTG